ncbi:hypothetical protein T484DRAFT_3306295 [Baffinella frigidus]|nr:hypothetical protein T484DRAFT_3306295 [Cryptophyta sp. CCMP2293]
MLSLQIPSTERRVVGICWEKLKPKGPQGSPPGLEAQRDPLWPALPPIRQPGYHR